MDNKFEFPKGFTPYDKFPEIENKSGILVAFSGGADSMALFSLTAKYCEKNNISFYACHVNHGIRGDEAIRDRDFCIETAKNCKFCKDIFVLNADVPALAAKSMRSIELEARIVRYGFFEKVMKEHNLHILATAHNSDDNLETLLFNMARGSGIKGMCGIPSVRVLCDGIYVVRPILNMSKKEIVGYCEENSLPFVFDSTNAEIEYSRNLLRARAVPVLEQINKDVRNSALRLSKIMAQTRAFMESESDKFLKENLQSGKLSTFAVANCDDALLPFVLQSYICKSSMNIDLQAMHIEAILDLCKGHTESSQKQSRISLPNLMCAKVCGGFLTFEKDESRINSLKVGDLPESNAENATEKEQILKEGANILPNGDVMIYLKSDVFSDKSRESETIAEILRYYNLNETNIYKFATKIAVKSATIDSCLVLRHRLEGDRIFTKGMHKSVKKLMCDCKIPQSKRNSLPIVCDKDGILWIPFVALRSKKAENTHVCTLIYVEKQNNNNK